MNISWFHISCTQKTDKRPYSTVGGVLDHLEHYKRIELYVNTIWFSHIGVCGLPMNKGRQHACAKSQPEHCGGNIRKWYLLSKYALQFDDWLIYRIFRSYCLWRHVAIVSFFRIYSTCSCCLWGWDGAVVVVIRLQAGCLRNHGSIHRSSRKFFFSPKCPNWLWNPSTCLFKE
jgi:hypothetical protein